MVGKAIIKDHLDAPKKVREKRRGSSSTYIVERARVFEIEKLIQYRHGPFVDTDDQIIYAEMAAIHLREPNSIRIWCNHYCPGLNVVQIRRVIAQGIAPQRLPTADQVAAALGVTMAERRALDLRTIGAVDCTKEERAALRREAKREANRIREARRRRQTGAKPRAKFLAESVAETCRRLGISRKTYYKRKANEMKKVQPEGLVTGPCPHIKTTSMYMGTGTCYPPSPSRPGGVRGATLEAIKAAQHEMAKPFGIAGAIGAAAKSAQHVRPSSLAALAASLREAARHAPPTLREIEASIRNRGHRDWHAEMVQQARALAAAGVDIVEADDPNIDFGDGPEAA